jgi:hypothetical protein
VERQEENKQDRFILFIGLTTALGLVLFTWLPRLPTSLWTDETVSAWIIGGNWSDILPRAEIACGPGALYYCLLYLWSALFGSGESALRSFSLFCALLTAALLYKYASKRWNSSLGIFALVAFISNPFAMSVATDARPYALLILFCTLAVLQFQNYLATNRRYSLFLTAMASIGCAYIHILSAPLALVLAAQVYYPPTKSNLHIRTLIGSTAFIFLACLPLVPSTIEKLGNSESLFFAPAPSFAAFFFAFTHSELLIPFALSGLVLFLLTGNAVRQQPSNTNVLDRTNFWMLAFAISSPTVLYLFSVLTGSSVFVSRYFVWSLPGAILCLSTIVGSLRNEAHRNCLIGIFCLSAVAIGSQPQTLESEDWESALGYANHLSNQSPAVTLLYTGLSQKQIENVEQYNQNEALLLAPAFYYPLNSQSIALPQVISQGYGKEHWKTVVVPEITKLSTLRLVCLETKAISKHEGFAFDSIEHLSKLLFELGFSKTDKQDFRRVSVITFRRL